jgi:hypothetical protein
MRGRGGQAQRGRGGGRGKNSVLLLFYQSALFNVNN